MIRPNGAITTIRAKNGDPSGRSPLDFMGKTELAANLFRITQTDAKSGTKMFGVSDF